MKSASEILAELLPSKGDGSAFHLTRLWASWREVVGEPLAEYVWPLGHRERVLLLGGEDAVVLQEANFLVPEILKRVNQFLGGNVFDKVNLELVRGRSPLDGIRVGEVYKKQLMPRPEPLGNLTSILPQDNPVGSCYRAYVRFFETHGNSSASTRRKR